ncbi:EscF/YscF/HrpA family type III secretion system needle major subunit [Biostraticola tofi]|uniref:Type III secretion system (T3SS) needle MxiH/YscF/SsaG/EprI/PscF/EscF family protein n=1 Tax=Biostraticola tofi TaxID=466109 RepID=A0A4R3YVK9_9GAMM|nr:EscF/YscF/HrpA family type III secretion system needle major subunit [Biostraticola tofi]TCV96681.1 type III secretion system (T3SS) needle MxiH/YscF/SsaG/EprI/PscF/EscF family protein [Biostraticola tofi]
MPDNANPVARNTGSYTDVSMNETVTTITPALNTASDAMKAAQDAVKDDPVNPGKVLNLQIAQAAFNNIMSTASGLIKGFVGTSMGIIRNMVS